MTKTALIRCDASPIVGAGHAMRCYTIARELEKKGYKCTILTDENSYRFFSNFRSFERIDPNLFFDNPRKHTLFVIDHYDYDRKYEEGFRPYVSKIIVIDDLANRFHDCDYLIDYSPARTFEDYKKLVPEHCQLLLGLEYAILQLEFAQLRPQALKKRNETRKIDKVLVNLGGGNSKGNIIKILQLINESTYCGCVDVALGFSFQLKSDISSFAKKMKNEVNLYTNADMPQLIYDADLSFGAAGVGAWERVCLGLPSLLIKIADNQEKNYQFLDSFFRQQGDMTLSQKFEFFLNNLEKLNECSNIYSKAVDGFGINRIIQSVEDNLAIVCLRQATIDDLLMTWTWQQEKSIRQYTFNKNAPTIEEHTNWFKQRLTDSLGVYCIICYKDTPCGVINLQFNADLNMYELGYLVSKSFQGKGIGSKAVLNAVGLVHPFKLYARVVPENIASLKAIEKARFVKFSENTFVST